jgi:phosphotransferase system  glucose/maltose/N-acetylglucosamine-specific IIC component
MTYYAIFWILLGIVIVMLCYLIIIFLQIKKKVDHLTKKQKMIKPKMNKQKTNKPRKKKQKKKKQKK